MNFGRMVVVLVLSTGMRLLQKVMPAWFPTLAMLWPVAKNKDSRNSKRIGMNSDMPCIMWNIGVWFAFYQAKKLIDFPWAAWIARQISNWVGSKPPTIQINVGWTIVKAPPNVFFVGWGAGLLCNCKLKKNSILQGFGAALKKTCKNLRFSHRQWLDVHWILVGS